MLEMKKIGGAPFIFPIQVKLKGIVVVHNKVVDVLIDYNILLRCS